ncbi:MAG TPA: hypothetical protein VKP30_17685, partial [Polyangiaceae bacterium]|nr:hypothetical protein [Polyangiaceae bacterium]
MRPQVAPTEHYLGSAHRTVRCIEPPRVCDFRSPRIAELWVACDHRWMRYSLSSSRALLVTAALGTVSAPSLATTIEVTPSDSYTKIEAAKAGDEVLIHPGTYRFRVFLTAKATASSPIVIRAKDPLNPPVWDLGAGNLEDAPGSYTAGDRGRGCWQLSGASNVHISDLVIMGCHNASFNAAGIRYYATSTGIRLRNVYFHDNDNGLTGGTENSEIVVEFCEFARNGNLQASAPTHNIYVYGGTFTLRYSYAHDPTQGQNFHIRAKESVLEYNWFSRAKSYAGDLMTNDDSPGTGASTQNMLLRGNVIVQGATQENTSQIIALYNDGGATNLTLRTRLLHNTFVGNGDRAALVHLSNADGTVMNVELSNNIVYGTSRPGLIEDPAHGTVNGSNNWLVTGADATGLSGTVFGSDPAFKNATQNDFTLAAGSTAIGAALGTIDGLPTAEYYRDETQKCGYRPRSSTKDVGAFESTTTGAGISSIDSASSGGTLGTGGGAAVPLPPVGGRSNSSTGNNGLGGGNTRGGNSAT